MFDMAKYVEIKRLIEEIEAIEDRLTPNELEMYHSLKAKHAEPGHVDFDDQTCLEVMLRNIEIRKRYDLEPRKDPGRVIELKRVRGGPKRRS